MGLRYAAHDGSAPTWPLPYPVAPHVPRWLLRHERLRASHHIPILCMHYAFVSPFMQACQHPVRRLALLPLGACSNPEWKQQESLSPCHPFSSSACRVVVALVEAKAGVDATLSNSLDSAGAGHVPKHNAGSLTRSPSSIIVSQIVGVVSV